MMLRRRSKTPKRKTQILNAKEESTTDFGTPQTTVTTSSIAEELEHQEENMDAAMVVLKVPLPSTNEAPPPSQRRSRSLTRSQSLWRRRKQSQDYASWVYNKKLKELEGVGTKKCIDIFRKTDKATSTLAVNYMPRQFSQEYSFVEIILGDNETIAKRQPGEPTMESAGTVGHGTISKNLPYAISPSRNHSTSDIPVEVMTKKKSTNEALPKVEKQPDKVTPGHDEKNALKSPIQADVTNHDTLSGIPIATIEVKRKRSDFVSELSEPPVVQPATVASVRKALIEAQRRLAGASRWGKKVSPEILLKAFIEVADSLESKTDRAMLRNEMERIMAESRAIYEDSPPSSETEESTADESYVPVGMCQFPGGQAGVDDASETSSFVDWLDQTQGKRGKWKATFDVFNLSNLWSDKLPAEWESFLPASDEESVPFQRVESPPLIHRINSESKGFFPLRSSNMMATSHRDVNRGRERTRSKETRPFGQALDKHICRAKPDGESLLESDKTLLTSFPVASFNDEEWIEREAQRILRNKSLQRIRSELEKRKKEERELHHRLSGKQAEKNKCGQRQMIDKRVLGQFEVTRQPSVVLDGHRRSRSTSRPPATRSQSLQRTAPSQSVSKTKLPVAGYQVYRPDIFPKFADAYDHDIPVAAGRIRTNTLSEIEDPETTPVPHSTTTSNTQRLLTLEKEQSQQSLRHEKRRSKSMDMPGRRLYNRVFNPRQLV